LFNGRLRNLLRGLHCHGGCRIFGNGCAAGAHGSDCSSGSCDAAPACGC
jgi:hypothetical protein